MKAGIDKGLIKASHFSFLLKEENLLPENTISYNITYIHRMHTDKTIQKFGTSMTKFV